MRIDYTKGERSSKELILFCSIAKPRKPLTSGGYQRIFDASNLDLSCVFLRLRQVVGGLHS
jgi:hypothetical protein